MRKKQKAAREYVQEVVRGMIIDDDINTGDMEEAFIAGVDWQNKKAIEAFKGSCPCWSRFQQDRKCDECAYLKNFCNQLD